MRSISILLAAALCGCMAPKYGVERQLTLSNGSHPVWAVAPVVNLSGQEKVDPILQADLVFQQLQEVNNMTVIPVERVVAVFAALHIDKIESEAQAALVCQQLGADAIVVPTITIYDPYDPPRLGAALQLLGPGSVPTPNNVDPRILARQAMPTEDQTLPVHASFIQVVGMYDAQNGSVRAAVLDYAKGRHDPVGPLGSREYFLSTDRYCGFVYHVLIQQILREIDPSHQQPSPQVTAYAR